jgi:cytochrome c oxidase accessory protein FixG
MASRSLPILGQAPARSVLRPDGGRNFVVPADVTGRYTRRRYQLFLLLILVYVALPWIEIGGHPAVFLDIENRAFYLFGATFNAQDTWLAFFLLSGMGFLLTLATALWGRVWCGYACPQTVFLEGVYRRIERAIEGPRNLRLKRDEAGFSLDRTLRKVVKHGCFLALSFVVAHVFLSYFVSLPQIVSMVQQQPAAHPEAFAWALGTTLLVYGNFAWFREQLCLIVCPYGRLQSVLTDSDTLVIGYDVRRGEPRGKAKAADRGDCVDCARCVVVCPTGIDIRNGLQLDCIGCAACIDACDEVMTKLKRPVGLIRYDSQNGLDALPKRWLRPRIYVYALLGALGLCVSAIALRARTPFEANLLRLQGAPFVLEGARVRNALELHLVNKHAATTTFRVEGVRGAGLEYVMPAHEVALDSLAERRLPIFVLGPNDRAPRRVRIEVSDGTTSRMVEATFIAP